MDNIKQKLLHYHSIESEEIAIVIHLYIYFFGFTTQNINEISTS